MKNTVMWVVVLLTLVGAGVLWYMNRSGTGGVVPYLEKELPPPLVVIMSPQNASGMSGTAVLTALNGGTLVRLDLTEAPADVMQPAHIHAGSCEEIGDVLYPLEFPVNGISETTLDVPLADIVARLPLALNVHKSAEEANVYVACGDLI